MLQQQVYIINTVLMVLDAVCIIAAGYGAFIIRLYESYGIWTMDTNTFSASVLLVMVVNNYMMGKFKLYSDMLPSSYSVLWWSILKSIVVAFGALTVGIFLFQEKSYSRLFLLFFFSLSLVQIAFYRSLFQLYFTKIAKKGFNSREILVVSDKQRGEFVTNLLKVQLSWGHEVIGRLAVEKDEENSAEIIGYIDDLPQVLREYTVDEVIFAIGEYHSLRLTPYLEICKKMGVAVRILPAMWKEGEFGISIEKCQDVPFLTLRVSNFNATGLLYKRVLDFIGGLVGTFIFLIHYPFVALAIKRESPGPVIYKQKRVGQNGRVFNLYKFRTMCQDADERRKELVAANEMNGAMFKIENDPRITKVGRWLRKTSIDEIPQFFNVLIGEMSLVGTRPPMVEEVETYKPDHLRRISFKPGITGLWQVSGRNKITDFEQIVRLDCSYLERWRFFTDLKILVKTIWVVLKRKGAI